MGCSRARTGVPPFDSFHTPGLGHSVLVKSNGALCAEITTKVVKFPFTARLAGQRLGHIRDVAGGALSTAALSGTIYKVPGGTVGTPFTPNGSGIRPDAALYAHRLAFFILVLSRPTRLAGG